MSATKHHLQPTAIIDSDNESVRAFTAQHVSELKDETGKAVRLYYAVRDGIRYNPYTFALDETSLKASATLEAGEGWCVPKAALLAACCRALGIPARVGFADVRNHLSTQRMRDAMKTDIFYWHGYTSIFLNGNWLKATPAFNVELCEKFRLKPLEFDGQSDSLYHSFDLEGNRHMEYINFRGEYDDVPLDEMRASFMELYGATLFADDSADFEKDSDNE